VHGEVF